MFRSPRDQRTFLTLLMTYFLDLVGYSIVFPVLAPLLLNPGLHFFAPLASTGLRTTILGLIFATFGIAQLIGAPIVGTLADHYGRYKLFLGTIGISVFGYALLALAVYSESLFLLFLGRAITGFCSGNFPLAQSATADLTDAHNRSKAFGILMGVGAFGFVIGPWFGGRLANPDWLFGSGAFIFAAIASIINLLLVFFFFVETWHGKKEDGESLFKAFKDIKIVIHHKILRTILLTYLIFAVGWGFFLIFAPTFLVQKFSLSSGFIGDIYAYLAVVAFFVMTILNKELGAYFSVRSLLVFGLLLAAIGVALFIVPQSLWLYWIFIPIAGLGGGLCWTNLGALLSMRAPENMQGRALGAGGSMWSIGQIVSPLVAGPLAGWNLYSPMTLGAGLIFISFIYFVICYRD